MDAKHRVGQKEVSMSADLSSERANLDEDAIRRRERGRQAQAAFRKRQAHASQKLKDHNRDLKDKIEKVVNATHGDERPELLDAIASLAHSVDVDITRLTHMKRGYQSSQEIIINPKTRDFMYESGDPGRYDVPPSTFPQRRVDYGVWLDPLHYTKVSLPPEDIVPYLGPGANTFAGRLFWFIMEHGHSKCDYPHPDQAMMRKRVLGHAKAMDGIRPPFIKAMVEARIQYKQTGEICHENAAAGESDLATAVCGQVLEEYQATGRDPTLWLSCLSTETHVRSMVGDGIFDSTDGLSGSETGPFHHSLLEGIQCRLYDTFVCFGDGPRWTTDIVNEALHEWISRESSTANADPISDTLDIYNS
ncbi:unnamed protein product [Clonostachys byssicola]|uniref:BZIP domain-containing protein n=1 Tax=Clonostachys byssicola TaxID=160290 RepID=A0A9N9U9L6_9HYPO|nr:unnamed protein product [Clonostachys byssicola]